MTEALRTVLPIAVAIAIFPVPIVATVLLVGSNRGRTKCAAFVAAWVAGLTAVGAIVLVLADGADASEAGEPATWVRVVLVALGGALIAAAVKQWRRRPGPGEEPPTPSWMRTIDDVTVAKAGAVGFALSALNPKNVALTIAAAAEIAAFGSSADQQIVVLVAFVVLASIGVATPLVVSLALGERSRAPLDALRGWMVRNNALVMAILFALIGAKLIGDALFELG